MKTYFDTGTFKSGLCGKKGIATESDLSYCCWCCNCVCVYNMCTKPCTGGVVAVTLFPNESACMFKIATRCCGACPCCVNPVLGFVKDSGNAKEELLKAMRAAEAWRKQGAAARKGKGAPPAEEMER